ncbi:hypothetical protein HF086_014716 [Spodoptera exigua]|uniref:Minor histocompatibility antigen H13 n=1 Tax=Spodoptera exigua TaxID=7107 RepID=A0A922SBS4_SPOEX|nr:hypothetical protein HF086_014716 [Spodoptera exigua]
MAESATENLINIEEAVKETVKNVTDKPPTSIEGIAIAYLSLVIMAVLPIFFGAFRSVKYLKEQKESGERHETMSNKDALMFPLIASAALFGLYIFFQFFSKEYINLLLTGYFFFLGVLALSHLLSPIISFMVPACIPNVSYHIHFTRGEDDTRSDIVNYKFTSYDIICIFISLAMGGWYILKKAINETSDKTECFCRPTVVFPQDLLVNGLDASNFAMLGLGDIVVPGIFIALLLRFDKSLKRNSEFYFSYEDQPAIIPAGEDTSKSKKTE